MSDEKQLGGAIPITADTQVNGTGNSNSMVSLLTMSNPERAIGEAIDRLVFERKDWENNELTRANDVLYNLLQHCYALNNTMIGSDSMAKNLRKGLANYMDEKGYQFKDSTPLITKIVRCVFGVDRRRVNSYSSALRVAISEKISVLELPGYFRAQGGIEEVRRKAVPQSKNQVNKVELGRAVLEADALAKVHSDVLNAAFSTQSTEEGVVLLATRGDDGSFNIHRVVQTASVVRSALAACSSVGAEKEKVRRAHEELLAIEADREQARAQLRVA